MIKTVTIIISFLLFFSGCASKETPPPVASPGLEATTEALKVKAGWEAKWEERLARARKEGVVQLYTTQAIELRQS